MLANLSWSSGLIADGTGSELARAVWHPDVCSLRHMSYAMCHTVFHIPYSIYLHTQYHHEARVWCATKATVKRGVVTVG